MTFTNLLYRINFEDVEPGLQALRLRGAPRNLNPPLKKEKRRRKKEKGKKKEKEKTENRKKTQ